MSTKNPLTPAGIEPATFRFVAQHLNHCATAVPKYGKYGYKSTASTDKKLTLQPGGLMWTDGQTEGRMEESHINLPVIYFV